MWFTSAKERICMKKTEQYLRVLFSSLFSALPHLDPTVAEPGTICSTGYSAVWWLCCGQVEVGGELSAQKLGKAMQT